MTPTVTLTVLIVTLAAVWLAWVIFNVSLWLASPWLVADRGAFTNGLVIVVPDAVRNRLNGIEYLAICAHERGHKHLWHAERNVLARCFLIARTPQQAFAQELEADDFAVAEGFGMALESALRKLGTSKQDEYRARRLAQQRVHPYRVA